MKANVHPFRTQYLQGLKILRCSNLNYKVFFNFMSEANRYSMMHRRCTLKIWLLFLFFYLCSSQCQHTLETFTWLYIQTLQKTKKKNKNHKETGSLLQLSFGFNTSAIMFQSVKAIIHNTIKRLHYIKRKWIIYLEFQNVNIFISRTKPCPWTRSQFKVLWIISTVEKIKCFPHTVL